MSQLPPENQEAKVRLRVRVQQPRYNHNHKVILTHFQLGGVYGAERMVVGAPIKKAKKKPVVLTKNAPVVIRRKKAPVAIKKNIIK